MANDNFYSKGTIKIKNADGVSVPFMPNTDISNVKNISDGTTLSQTITNLNTRISEAATKGGIKVMYEEPNAENTAEYGAKTLIGYVLPEEWKFQVKSTRFGEKKAAIPIYLYNQPGITLYVDWGDGSTSTLTSSNYTKTDGSASIHTYSEQNKIYTISITSHDWHKLYLYASSNSSGYSTSSSPDGIIGCFKLSLYKILNPIPKVKGIQYYSNSAYSTTKADNSFAYLFSSCSYSLQSDAYPENLFEKNLDAVSFEYCFCYNGRVSIPKKLFKGMSSAKNFQYCFYYSNIISIPEGLFDDCISALNFNLCFGFTQINLIPQQLFYNNTEATSFIGCFTNVGTFNDFTLHIGSAKVLSCGDFVTEKENAVRIIYVPSGSTTETAFNSVASSLGLTIIAE